MTVAAILCGCAAAAAFLPAGGMTPAEQSRSRVVRHFDFEEAERAPIEFPSFFKRNIAEDRGFLRFGSMRPDDDAAAAGRWSFRFELDGASLSASTPTGVIPVLPLADYEVTAAVRTQDLRHARARLVAWLTDVHGEMIPGSRRQSEAIDTNGAWRDVSVLLRGDHEQVADMIVELQVLQPDQLGAARGSTPVGQDVQGTAWFDEVVIRHVPRIDLSVNSPINVLAQPKAPRLHLLVRDLSSAPMTALLRVTDLDGRPVVERTMRAPRDPDPVPIELPVDRCGWYSATVELFDAAGTTGRARADFALVPPAGAGAAALGTNISTIAPPMQLEAIPPLVQLLGVGRAAIPIWERGPQAAPVADDDAARTMIEALLAMDLDVHFALRSIPADIAAANGLEPAEVLALISGPPATWRQRLDPLLINFGLRVRRWQLGTDPAAADERAQRAAEQLGQFVPDHQAVIPVAADEVLPETTAGLGASVTVPFHVRPEALLTDPQAWGGGRDDVLLTLEPLPLPSWTPRQQALDLALRALHGWRAGLGAMSLDAPWRIDARGACSPEPAYAVWRGLSEALRGRRFAGQWHLGEGVHCWLMESDDPAGHALVAWREQSPGSAPQEIELVLGAEPVAVVDLFGNARALMANPTGSRRVPIGDMPVLVRGIDIAAAKFQAQLALTPSFIESAHQVHECELHITNPWPVAITGRIGLEGADDVQLSPRLQQFTLPPGGSVRVPVDARCARGIVAGPRHVTAMVELEADRPWRMRAPLPLEVGWQQVRINAAWRIARDAGGGSGELLIIQSVTNQGQGTLDLDAFVRADGLAQTRSGIAALPPGATTVKTFRLPGGPAKLAGRTVYVGVIDRGGTAQLTRAILIPDLEAPASVAGAGDDDR